MRPGNQQTRSAAIQPVRVFGQPHLQRQLNDIDIDICPDCAQRFNDQTIGTVHIRRDHRDKLSPYLLEYQPTDPKEDQA